METIKNHLNELVAFHEVAKSQGFTQAAEKLSLSKAQLSKLVARLETILKAKLFHRTTRKITLTEEGHRLFSYAEKIFELTREASEGMEDMTHAEEGLVRITAPNSLGDWFAPPLLERFQESYPKLKIEIDLSNVRRRLIEERYDFALRAMEEKDPELIAKFLGHLKDVVVAHPSFVKKNKLKGIHPNELENIDCILHSHQHDWNVWKLQKGTLEKLVKVQGQFACSSYMTSKLMCLRALGVARLPLYLCQEEIRKGELVCLYKDYSIKTHPLYLVYPMNTYRARKHKVVKEMILSWIKDQRHLLA